MALSWIYRISVLHRKYGEKRCCSHQRVLMPDGHTVPEHGASVRAEGEGGDGAVVALKHTHTLAGAQVPQPDATVQRGGEELQQADVWVELDQAAQTHKDSYNTELF